MSLADTESSGKQNAEWPRGAPALAATGSTVSSCGARAEPVTTRSAEMPLRLKNGLRRLSMWRLFQRARIQASDAHRGAAVVRKGNNRWTPAAQANAGIVPPESDLGRWDARWPGATPCVFPRSALPGRTPATSARKRESFRTAAGSGKRFWRTEYHPLPSSNRPPTTNERRRQTATHVEPGNGTHQRSRWSDSAAIDAARQPAGEFLKGRGTLPATRRPYKASDVACWSASAGATTCSAGRNGAGTPNAPCPIIATMTPVHQIPTTSAVSLWLPLEAFDGYLIDSAATPIAASPSSSVPADAAQFPRSAYESLVARGRLLRLGSFRPEIASSLVKMSQTLATSPPPTL